MNTHKRYGVISSYVHTDAQFGSLVELACESRAVSLSRELRELAQHVAMQVAATNPLVLHRQDLTGEMQAAEMRRLAEREIRVGRSADFARRVAAAGVARFHEQACLLEQKFIQDAEVTIRQLVDSTSAVLKEDVHVVRFVRFSTGECNCAAGGMS